MHRKVLTFPTILTLIRLIVSPLILPILLVAFLPQNNYLINALLALFFACLSLTDFFDGYLARRLQQETQFGRLLDPMADKALVYATLIALLAIHKIYFYWVVLLIGRDFFMMGLRSIALEHGFSIHVMYHARIKTVIQMSWLAVIILNPYQQYGFGGAPWWNGCEQLLLALTLALSLGSAFSYYQLFVTRWRQI